MEQQRGHVTSPRSKTLMCTNRISTTAHKLPPPSTHTRLSALCFLILKFTTESVTLAFFLLSACWV